MLQRARARLWCCVLRLESHVAVELPGYPVEVPGISGDVHHEVGVTMREHRLEWLELRSPVLREQEQVDPGTVQQFEELLIETEFDTCSCEPGTTALEVEVFIEPELLDVVSEDVIRDGDDHVDVPSVSITSNTSKEEDARGIREVQEVLRHCLSGGQNLGLGCLHGGFLCIS